MTHFDVLFSKAIKQNLNFKKAQTLRSNRNYNRSITWMSFTSLLNQIKHKSSGLEQNKPSRPYSSPSASSPSVTTTEQPVPINAIPKGYRAAPLDPAIHRLKELRRLEKEKEAAEKAKRRPERTTRTRSSVSRTPKASSSSSPSTITKRALTSSTPQSETKRRSTSPVKRLTFSELMNQAQQKTKSLKEGKEPSPLGEHKFVSKTKRETKSSTIPRKAPALISKKPISSTTTAKTEASRNAPPARVVKPTPKPLARPSAKLEAKLAARRKLRGESQASKQEDKYSNNHEEYDEEEYSSDDFVVDDDEEDGEENVGYDRNEIWKIFGRSRQRYNDYDDDSSDMEATGAEILREETRAEKSAKLEEKAEAERERRRIEEKKRRLGKR